MRSSLTGFFPAAAFFPPAGAAEAVFLAAVFPAGALAAAFFAVFLADFLAVFLAAFSAGSCAACFAGSSAGSSAGWSADSFTAMTATPSHP
ncbi:hypothetical protein [Streptomyces sp. NPDC021224]|uniref:hypothetical protein n=1 Tax=unclassified Streptomyces TaxID=2593676 RepID=UPI0037A8B284